MRETLPNCFIELHLHLDGSLSPASVRELAAMQGLRLPERDAEVLERLTVSEHCRDLNEYLEKFAFPCALLQTEAALETAAYRLGAELMAQGVLYAEIRFAPQKHTERGLTQEQAVCAVLRGLNRCSLRTGLILCCMRGRQNGAENLETAELAVRYRESGVCALDLAGAEALFPTAEFAGLFAYAAERGVPFTLHAGEADGPESIRQALSFGARRIGHGVRACEDPALLERLAADRIPLELCPTSNLQTGIFPDLAHYPLRTFLEAGVRVTVNTDNMSVSHTTLRKEFRQLIQTFALTERETEQLFLYAADAAFAEKAVKRELRTAIRKRFRHEENQHGQIAEMGI